VSGTPGTEPIRNPYESLFVEPTNPLDNLLIAYREDIEFEIAPDEAEQEALVSTVKLADTGSEAARVSRKALVDRNLGRVATLLYPYRYQADSKELIKIGSIALVRAALTYGRKADGTFDDYSMAVVRQVLAAQFPDVEVGPHEQGRPEDLILQLVPDVYDPAVEDLIRPAKRSRSTPYPGRLPENPDIILPVLHLPNAEVMSRTGLTYRGVYAALGHAKEKYEVTSRMGAALRALEDGVQFIDLRNPGPLSGYTIRERTVVSMLGAYNRTEIGTAVGLGQHRLTRFFGSLLCKMDARTLIEAAVAGRVHNFAPTENELEHSALKDFSPREKDIVSMIHLPVKEIAAALGADKTNISHAFANMRIKIDVSNNVELARELRRRGIKFDVPRSDVELSERELKVVSMIGLKPDIIARGLGVSHSTVKKLVPAIMRKVGARTYIKLALMFPDQAQPETSAEPNELPKAA
jgi:DNA-binding NarL/FixJ family response regulator